MDLIKTLAHTGVIVGAMLGASPEARSTEYFITPEQNLQTYLDNAQNGDIFNINGNRSSEANYHADKSIAIRGANGTQPFINGSFTFNGNSSSTLRNLWINNGSPYIVTPGGIDNSTGNAVNVIGDELANPSLKASNCYFDGTNSGVYFNTNGNLTLNSCIFSTQSLNGVSLEKLVGSVNITQNLITGSEDGIKIGGEASVQPELYIINNTLVNTRVNAIDFKTPLYDTIGDISNNSITDGVVGINNFNYATNFDIDGNDFYNILDFVDGPLYSQSLLQHASNRGNSPEFTGNPALNNYYLEPGYTDDGTFKLRDDSQLIGKGRYIPDVTTWFSNQQSTYIGYATENPVNIPEPNALTLLAIAGAGTGLYLLTRKEKNR